MLPKTSLNFFNTQSTASHLPEQPWESRIPVASKEELETLLNTRCMTSNQLQEIINRPEITWSSQESAWIAYRIRTLADEQLAQETEIPRFVSLSNRQHTHINSEGNIRSVSAHPPSASMVQPIDIAAEESTYQFFNYQLGNLTSTLSGLDINQSDPCLARTENVTNPLPEANLDQRNVCVAEMNSNITFIVGGATGTLPTADPCRSYACTAETDSNIPVIIGTTRSSEENPTQNSACATQVPINAPDITEQSSSLPQIALNLIATYSNKSDSTICHEISSNNVDAIYDLLDYQPMSISHLNAILDLAEHLQLSTNRISTLKKRISIASTGAIETSTPFLRFSYHMIIESGSSIQEFSDLLQNHDPRRSNHHYNHPGSMRNNYHGRRHNDHPGRRRFHNDYSPQYQEVLNASLKEYTAKESKSDSKYQDTLRTAINLSYKEYCINAMRENAIARGDQNFEIPDAFNVRDEDQHDTHQGSDLLFNRDPEDYNLQAALEASRKEYDEKQ